MYGFLNSRLGIKTSTKDLNLYKTLSVTIFLIVNNRNSNRSALDKRKNVEKILE